MDSSPLTQSLDTQHGSDGDDLPIRSRTNGLAATPSRNSNRVNSDNFRVADNPPGHKPSVIQ